jgi:hypothetical protein
MNDELRTINFRGWDAIGIVSCPWPEMKDESLAGT